VELSLRDAVFGTGAEAQGAAVLLRTPIRVRATLTPETARRPSPGRREEPCAGTLTVHVDDGDGHAWQHAYRATGPIMLDGDDVAAPVGLVIPGASAPSPEADARRGRITGGRELGSIELSMNGELSDDPRWH
jgi:hypothetical protein